MNRKLAHSAVFFFSFSALVASASSQLFHGAIACKLCQLQGLCYALIGGISLWGLFSKRTLAGSVSLSLISLAAFSVSIYHTGIQFGFIADRCRQAQQIDSLIDFESLIFTKASCGQITWDIGGVSLAPINAVFFGIVASIGIVLFFQSHKRKCSPAQY